VIKDAEFDGAEEQVPGVVVDLFAADGFARQDSAHKEKPALPFDFSVRAHAAYLEVPGIFRFTQVSVVAAWRWPVVVGWWCLAQALMGTLRIVDPLEVIEGPLLGPATAGRWRRRVLMKRQVKAFMASILLGLAGRDTLGRYAGLDKPDRQR
jgi:hypothetical protein